MPSFRNTAVRPADRSKGVRWVVSLALLAAPAMAQQRGTLISAEPMAGGQTETLQAWRIRYWTADDAGKPLAVTGIVAAPRGATPSTPRRVIAWTHGTWGIAESCAPSLSPKVFDVTPAIAAVADGYVVVAPDYPGLGSPGPNPYLVGPITGRSVLDAVRAARAIPAAGAGPAFAVWGQSQGGHAAIWTGQMASDEAPELRLVGVAAAAPPTDLAANFQGATNANAKAFLTALTAASWSKVYNIPLVIGRRGTPALIERMASRCVVIDSKPKVMTILGILALKRGLQGVDLASTPPWASIVAANSVAPTARYPVLVAQTKDDPLVAPDVTRAWARKLCANRVRVHWIDLPGGDHPTTAQQSAPATLRWIADRFEGKSAPSDCGRI